MDRSTTYSECSVHECASSELVASSSSSTSVVLRFLVFAFDLGVLDILFFPTFSLWSWYSRMTLRMSPTISFSISSLSVFPSPPTLAAEPAPKSDNAFNTLISHSHTSTASNVGVSRMRGIFLTRGSERIVRNAESLIVPLVGYSAKNATRCG